MLYALIVIYNKKCEDSITIKKIFPYKNQINIIVFDNSDENNENERFCNNNNIKYYTEHKNIGLSKAYNSIISKIEMNDDNFLLILDDDTNITNEYINKIIEISNNKKENLYDIYVPIAKSNNKIISPSNTQFDCRVKAIKKIDDIDLKKITAINSCSFIRMSVFKNIKYNENLFLDYVDHDFFRKARKEKIKIKVLNEAVFQNFSRDEKNPNINSVLLRFKIYMEDFKKYCKEIGWLGEIFYFLNITKLKIKNTVKYKTIKFWIKEEQSICKN